MQTSAGGQIRIVLHNYFFPRSVIFTGARIEYISSEPAGTPSRDVVISIGQSEERVGDCGHPRVTPKSHVDVTNQAGRRGWAEGFVSVIGKEPTRDVLSVGQQRR